MRLGIYDSGLGGLTIKQEIDRILPGLDTIYFADEQILPLGEKSDEQIITRLERVCEYLFEHNCTLILLACNTASVVGIRHLQQRWLTQKTRMQPRNILGVSAPLVEYTLARMENESHLLLLATTATIRTQFYQKEFEKRGIATFVQAMPQLAVAIETGDTNMIELSLRLVSEKMSPADSSSIVLACTHYPIILQRWRHYFPSSHIFDPSAAVAEKLESYLGKHPEYSIAPGSTSYVTTGSESDFTQKVKSIFGTQICEKQVRTVGV